MVPFWIFWVTSRPYCKVMILLNVKYFISTMVQDFQWPWTTHNLDFQGHAIWRWISQKLYEIQTYLQWSTNRDLHTPYSRVSFRMTLSDLEWNIQWHEASRGLSATAELLVWDQLSYTISPRQTSCPLGLAKIEIFWPISRYISERIADRHSYNERLIRRPTQAFDW